MQLKAIKTRPDIGQNKKAYKSFSRFMGFLEILKREDLNDEVIEKLNTEIDKINGAALKKLNSQIKKSQLKMLQIIEKEQKLVPKNYYRNTWMGFGVGAIGIPLGVLIGLALDHMGYLMIGLPFGLAIGAAIGILKDKKAEKEGRQMNIEM